MTVREAFEAWADGQGMMLDYVKGFPGVYRIKQTYMAWESWLAGRESMREDVNNACGKIGPDAYKVFQAIKELP